MLPTGDFQINVAQGLTVTTHHRHMRKGEQGRWGHTVILTERRRDARGPPNPMGGSGEVAGIGPAKGPRFILKQRQG